MSNYNYFIVESFIPTNLNGRHGRIHIKPVSGQKEFKENMFVECSKQLSNNFPKGTKFRIKAKITNKDGGVPFIYSHYSWPFEVLK